jgi:glycerophosphoryl diester phosphodiesterase
MITNIAHRGARLLAPENTCESAQFAKESGAHMWEIDVQYNADKQIVVIHDDTLERTTNVHQFTEFKARFPWRVCDFTSDELQKLNFGDAFNNTNPTKPSKKYDVPILDTAITFSKEIGIDINIEIKDIEGRPGHKKIATHVYDTVQKNSYLPHVLFSSFNIDYLFQIRNIDLNARIALLLDQPDDDLFHLLDRLNAQAYHPHLNIIERSLVNQLHQKKIQVNVWTLNNKDEMKRFIKMGVDGIITDDPALLNSLNKA